MVTTEADPEGFRIDTASAIVDSPVPENEVSSGEERRRFRAPVRALTRRPAVFSAALR
jgi:hypothetical protein